MRIEKSLNYLLIIAIIIILTFAIASGQDEGVIEKPITEPVVEDPAPVPVITNLDVLLIDKINGSMIKMNNCGVMLVGKMKIGEDSFDYNNTFIEGDRYEITIMIEQKE